MDINGINVTRFRTFLYAQWEHCKRDLPWRHTRNPYKILVSEIMLQQTQVARVIEKYQEFIDVYPTIDLLARSTPGAVLRLWQGMGYNRRAVYLRQAAGLLISQYDGVFPQDETALRTLPGVGRYTARAVLVFAFEQDLALVDTNIRRIITTHFFDNMNQSDAVIWEAAEKLLPKGKSWSWHQALMDYGAATLHLSKRHSVSKTHRAIPFRQSNRFFRGRIVELLRCRPYLKEELIHEMLRSYKKSYSFYIDLLIQLEHEKLIERSDKTVRLPE